MEIKDIIKQWLTSNGYDGLYNSQFDCACEIDDLLPCGEADVECSAGYKTKCDCEEKHNFHIEASKSLESQK